MSVTILQPQQADPSGGNGVQRVVSWGQERAAGVGARPLPTKALLQGYTALSKHLYTKRTNFAQ